MYNKGCLRFLLLISDNTEVKLLGLKHLTNSLSKNIVNVDGNIIASSITV